MPVCIKTHARILCFSMKNERVQTRRLRHFSQNSPKIKRNEVCESVWRPRKRIGDREFIFAMLRFATSLRKEGKLSMNYPHKISFIIMNVKRKFGSMHINICVCVYVCMCEYIHWWVITVKFYVNGPNIVVQLLIDGILKIQDKKLCIPTWPINILIMNPFEDNLNTCSYFHNTLCFNALWFCVMSSVMLQYKEQKGENRVLVLHNVD